MKKRSSVAAAVMAGKGAPDLPPLDEGVYRALLPSILRSHAGDLFGVMQKAIYEGNDPEKANEVRRRVNDCLEDFQAAAKELEFATNRLEELLRANNEELERRRAAERKAAEANREVDAARVAVRIVSEENSAVRREMYARSTLMGEARLDGPMAEAHKAVADLNKLLNSGAWEPIPGFNLSVKVVDAFMRLLGAYNILRGKAET